MFQRKNSLYANLQANIELTYKHYKAESKSYAKYVNETRVFESEFALQSVFITTEEYLLNKYILMHSGITRVQVKKLAQGFAKVNEVKFPLCWNYNKMAGAD